MVNSKPTFKSTIGGQRSIRILAIVGIGREFSFAPQASIYAPHRPGIASSRAGWASRRSIRNVCRRSIYLLRNRYFKVAFALPQFVEIMLFSRLECSGNCHCVFMRKAWRTHSRTIAHAIRLRLSMHLFNSRIADADKQLHRHAEINPHHRWQSRLRRVGARNSIAKVNSVSSPAKRGDRTISVAAVDPSAPSREGRGEIRFIGAQTRP